MTCEEAVALLDAGEEPPELAAHLADCRTCGPLAAVRAACAELPEAEVPEGFEDQVRRRLASAPGPGAAAPRWLLWTGVGVAALAAALALLIGVRSSLLPRSPSTTAAATAAAAAGTARGLFAAPVSRVPVPARTQPFAHAAAAAASGAPASARAAGTFAPGAVSAPRAAASGANVAASPASLVPPLAGGLLGRDIVQQAAVTLRVKDVTAAFAQLSDAASAAGGFVAQSDLTSGARGSRATATVRVPAGLLQTFLDRIGGLGTVTSQSRSSQDVTQQVVDVGARLTALRAEDAAYLRLYAKASSIADMIQVQQQLTQVQSQIDALQSQQQALTRMVDLATVTVTLVPSGGSGPGQGGGGTGVLQAAWAAMLAALRVLLLALGWALPWAAAAALGWLAVRLLRAGRRGL